MEKTFMTKQLTQILKNRRNLKSEDEDRLMNFWISRSFGSPEKMFSINFSKANTIFARVCIIRMIIVIFFVNGQEISKFKADNENVNFLTQFYLGSISKEFSATGSREVSLNGLSI